MIMRSYDTDDIILLLPILTSVMAVLLMSSFYNSLNFLTILAIAVGSLTVVGTLFIKNTYIEIQNIIEKCDIIKKIENAKTKISDDYWKEKKSKWKAYNVSSNLLYFLGTDLENVDTIFDRMIFSIIITLLIIPILYGAGFYLAFSYLVILLAIVPSMAYTIKGAYKLWLIKRILKEYKNSDMLDMASTYYFGLWWHQLGIGQKI